MNLYEKEIIEHAKSSAENMRVAVLVGLSFDALYDSLVQEFGRVLKRELLQKGFDEVDISSWEKSPRDGQSGIRCRRSHWLSEVSVQIAADARYGKSHYIGVRALKNKIPESERQRILNEMNKSIGEYE